MLCCLSGHVRALIIFMFKTSFVLRTSYTLFYTIRGLKRITETAVHECSYTAAPQRREPHTCLSVFSLFLSMRVENQTLVHIPVYPPLHILRSQTENSSIQTASWPREKTAKMQFLLFLKMEHIKLFTFLIYFLYLFMPFLGSIFTVESTYCKSLGMQRQLTKRFCRVIKRVSTVYAQNVA